MKTYVKNIILYIVALLGLLSFIALFSNPLQCFDSIKGTWSIYNVRAYLGERVNDYIVYRGAVIPIFGFVIPFIIAIALIIESFHQSWLRLIHVINTIFAVLLFISAILVLLTKDQFLSVNSLGETVLLRNGNGPKFSAICSTLGGVLLLFVTWFPSKVELKFIEK